METHREFLEDMNAIASEALSDLENGRYQSVRSNLSAILSAVREKIEEEENNGSEGNAASPA